MIRSSRTALAAVIGILATGVGCRSTWRWTNVSCAQLRSHASALQGKWVCVTDAVVRVGAESYTICPSPIRAPQTTRISVDGDGLSRALSAVHDRAKALSQERGFTPEEFRAGIGGPGYEFPARVCGKLVDPWRFVTDEGPVDVRGPVRVVTINDRKLLATVRRILGLLVAGDFERLERTATGGLDANELRSIFARWGKHLQMTPDADITYAFLGNGRGMERSNPLRWNWEYRLWTVEDGRTESTISITLVDGTADLYEFQIESVNIVDSSR